jgi:hypothetical protein
MVFNEGYEDFLEKIADKNIEFSFPESAKHILSLIEPATTIEALTRFVGYVIAVRDNQKLKTIDGKKYNQLTLKDFYSYNYDLPKEQSKLCYKFGIKCFVKGFYTGDRDTYNLFELFLPEGYKLRDRQTVGITVTDDEGTCWMHLISTVHTHNNKIFVIVPPLCELAGQPSEDIAYYQNMKELFNIEG